MNGPQTHRQGLSFDLVAPDYAERVDSPSRLRSRRGPDYRLRGLDLGHLEGEAPARHVGKVRPRRRYRRRLLVRWVLVLVVAGLAAAFLRMSVLQPFSVPSAAMVPTLQMGDQILVVKSSRLGGTNPRRRHRRLPPPEGLCVQHGTGSGRGPGAAGHHGAGRDYLVCREQDLRRREAATGARLVRLEVWASGIDTNPRTRMPPVSITSWVTTARTHANSTRFGPIARSAIVGKVFAVVVRGGHPHVTSSEAADYTSPATRAGQEPLGGRRQETGVGVRRPSEGSAVETRIIDRAVCVGTELGGLWTSQRRPHRIVPTARSLCQGRGLELDGPVPVRPVDAQDLCGEWSLPRCRPAEWR